MRATDLDLQKMLVFQPEAGRLLMGNERMIIFRALAFANLRRLLFEQLGHATARALLLHFGRLCGEGDYHAIGGGLVWDTPADHAMAGPILHAWEGIVAVVPDTEIVPGMKRMTGTWRNSYEADMHLAEFGPAREPVCYTLQGYAHGHASHAHGVRILCVETSCRAAGDPECRWEMRPDDEWGDHPLAVSLRDAFAATPQSFEHRLIEQTELVRRQSAAMLSMAAPVIEVWDRVLAVPISGPLDDTRANAVTPVLLAAVAADRPTHVIVDLTGVPAMDATAADALLRMGRAVQLLGSTCLVSGISPSGARTMAELGLGGDLRPHPTLKSALEHVLRERSAPRSRGTR